MSSVKTAAAGLGATGTAAVVTTNSAVTAVPFLDIPLFVIVINGVPGIVTPQAAIFMATGILSLLAIGKSVFFGKGKK